MALTIDVSTGDSWTVEQVIEYVQHNVDIRDDDSVASAAGAIKALANNRAFLRDIVHKQLLNWRTFQTGNTYTAQTFLLGHGKGFFLRANIWTPPAADAAVREAEKALYLYTVPHDHNFTFLTVGYLGSGYETEIYEYDPSCTVGYAGEKVDLSFLEQTRLSYGKVMMYRAGRDIHSQHHPEEFSVSLNLIVATPESGLREQYFFDIDRGTISGYVPIGTASRVALCEIARHVANDDTASLLDQLADRHPCHRTRAAAYDTLAQLAAADAESLWNRALRDDHAFVRRAAAGALEAMG